ncbi:2556_t:CDS:2 [Funneliformis caledonium]|uniref:2556_t:CDS:1 n=1 Tax=Funneliformis caledonium TaxID=1117310 RepID=A0A9N8VM29_9GLOM|nr:2556_t:CDS:2 [Funneliformis caledonium]
MKSSYRILVYLLILCFAVSNVYGEARIFEVSDVDTLNNSYIIQYESTLTSKITLDRIKNAGIKYTLRQDLENIMNGISVKLENHEDLHKCAEVSGINNIWPVRKFHPRLFTADNITGLGTFRQNSGFDGSGVKVGIIDNGLDYMHPAFGKCFKTPGCKTQFGYDFVGDGNVFNPNPDDDPLETCEGHGTHVAGIIAADDHERHFTGVAPGATLGIYRVIDCSSSTTDDLIIKGLEKATVDGMDVINMSLGGNFQAWGDTPLGIVLNDLALKGFVMVVSGSNAGNNGLFAAGNPDSTPNVITVGHVDNFQFFSFVLKPSNDPKKLIPYATTRISLRFPFTGPHPIVIANTTENEPEFDGCDPYNKSLNGKIALIRRGDCDVRFKIENAADAGATAVMFYNTDDSLPGTVPLSIHFPSLSISKVDAEYLKKQIRKNSSLTVSFPEKVIVIPLEDAGKPSRSSSWGPTFDMDIKPEVMAPGGRIFSTYPRNLGSYATISGTSMAAAYASGSIALYMQATGLRRGTIDPIKLRELLTYTANPIYPDSKDENAKIPISVDKQGGGLIDIVGAIKAKALIKPSKLLLNDSAHFNGTQTIRIKNTGKKTTKFTFSHIPSVSVRGWFDNQWVDTSSFVIEKRFAGVKFSKNSVIVRPGVTTKVKVIFTQPKNLPNDFGIYSGYVTISDSAQHQTYSLPYLGLKGDLHSLPTLSNDSYPFIERADNRERFDREDQIARFTLFKGNEREDVPVFLYLLNFGSRLVKLELYHRGDFTQTGYLGLLELDPDFINLDTTAPRNGGTGDFRDTFKIWSSGAVSDINGNVIVVPNGQYQALLSVLRPFGDPNKQEDIMTWRSPIIEIARR